MKKEIGGYIELISYKQGYNFYNYSNFNSARNAFLFYVLTKKIKKVYIPYFLCDSISNVCKNNKINFEYYHIDFDLKPIFEKPIFKNELLYIVNYFGILSNDEIRCFKKKYVNILLDNVQCFYKRAISNVPTIYSCRKFFGVPDGGYLSIKLQTQDNFIRVSAKNRMKHLFGRQNGLASDFYADFLKNEEQINNFSIQKMSYESEVILQNTDHDFIIKRRNENFKFLNAKLKQLNLFKIKFKNGPFCYPLLVKNGNDLRKHLIKNMIYVPRFWPNVSDRKNWIWESFLSNNLLPIPCDQRYSIEDMNSICEVILSYENKRK